MERPVAADTPPSFDDDAWRRFLAAATDVRPRLHRFCARMCGSALDGEDLVQETLVQAYRALSSLHDERRLEAWLFRIAHHRCVDFLRREHRHRERLVPFLPEHEPATSTDEPVDDVPIDAALAALVGTLPPKERAAVLLKDVLDYQLDEVADVVDSTLGGVKAALHRGRAKLHALHALHDLPDDRAASPSLDPRQRTLLAAYVDCFDRRDWDALRHLVRADARIEVVGFSDSTLRDLGGAYFGNYAALPWTWRYTASLVDGEPLAVLWRRDDDAWRPVSAARLWWEAGHVVRIRDYVHVDYLFADRSANGVSSTDYTGDID